MALPKNLLLVVVGAVILALGAVEWFVWCVTTVAKTELWTLWRTLRGRSVPRD